jgi:hypothetical protein
VPQHVRMDRRHSGARRRDLVIERLTRERLAVLTPLIWEHVNPYGRIELDINARLPLD